MFLRRRKSVEFGKLLAVFVVIYAILLLVGIGHRTALWDEFQNTALPFLLYDMTLDHTEIGLNLDSIRAYATDYHAHYSVFYSIIHHPPLHRVFLYLAFLAAGPGEVQGRAVSVAFSVMALLATYLLAYRLTRRRDISFLSAVTLALIPTFSEFSRLMMIEVPLVATTTLTVYAFLRYVESEKLRDAVFFGISAGLCVLTKNYGLLVFIPLGIHMIREKGVRFVFNRNSAIGIAIALAIAVPWYAFAALLPSVAGVDVDLMGAYAGYFVPNLEVIALAPSFYITTFSWVLGILSLAAFGKALMRRDGTDVLLIVWALSYIMLFTFAIGPSIGHLHRFIMPSLPAFAIMIARLFGDMIDSKRARYPWHIIFIMLVCSAALSAAYNASVDVRKPIDEAAVYAIENSDYGDGIITTDFYQTFYLLKHDRNLSVFNLNARDMETLDSIINASYASESRQAAGIKNPESYSYLVLEYPLQPKVAANPDFVEFIEESGCLKKEIVFGDDVSIALYRFSEECI